MQKIQKVKSSNLTFERLNVNVDTVFLRYDERKLFEENEHIGWEYTEEQYTIREYIHKISSDNASLSTALMETINTSYEEQVKNEQAIMELANLVGGVI